MLCDTKICEKRGISCFKSFGDEIIPDTEFCKHLRHIKCKIVTLAREQIEKKITTPNYRKAGRGHIRNVIESNNEKRMSVSRGTTYSDTEVTKNLLDHEDNEIPLNTVNDKYQVPPDLKNHIGKNSHEKILQIPQPEIILNHQKSVPNHVAPGAKIFNYWIKCITDYLTKKLKVLLIAIIIGILMWMALVYGAILGASLCSNGQFPTIQFGLSRTKNSVF